MFGKNPSVIVFNDTTNENHFGCQGVMTALGTIIGLATNSSNIVFYPLELSPLKKNRPLWAFHTGLTNDLLASGLIIVNGEGSIHHSNKRARGLAMIGPFAHSLEIPSMLVNATLYGNDSVTLDEMAAFTQLYARDRFTQNVMAGKEITVKYAPDLTFFHDLEIESDDAQMNTRTESQVCVNDSVLPYVNLKLAQFCQQNKWDQQSITFAKSSEMQSFRDYVTCLKRYQLVVTGRYHDVCFCINAKIPFIAIESNTNKISNLLNDVFGNCSRLIQADSLELVDINEFISYANSEISAIDMFKERSKAYYAELAEDMKSTFDASGSGRERASVEKTLSNLRSKGAKPLSIGFTPKLKFKKYMNKYFGYRNP